MSWPGCRLVSARRYSCSCRVSKSLQPEGALVGNAVMQAADARIGNVQRLKGLVDRLDDENAAAKRLAMADLVQAGPLAVPVLIQVLADTTQAGVHPAAIRTLQAIGSGSVDPLIATLETTDDRLKAVAIRVLGSLKARKAIPFLMAPALGGGQRRARSARPPARPCRRSWEALRRRTKRRCILSRQLDSYLSGTVPADVDERRQCDAVGVGRGATGADRTDAVRSGRFVCECRADRAAVVSRGTRPGRPPHHAPGDGPGSRQASGGL